MQQHFSRAFYCKLSEQIVLFLTFYLHKASQEILWQSVLSCPALSFSSLQKSEKFNPPRHPSLLFILYKNTKSYKHHQFQQYYNCVLLQTFPISHQPCQPTQLGPGGVGTTGPPAVRVPSVWLTVRSSRWSPIWSATTSHGYLVSSFW